MVQHSYLEIMRLAKRMLEDERARDLSDVEYRTGCCLYTRRKWPSRMALKDKGLGKKAQHNCHSTQLR